MLNIKMTAEMMTVRDLHAADARYHLDCWSGATAPNMSADWVANQRHGFWTDAYNCKKTGLLVWCRCNSHNQLSVILTVNCCMLPDKHGLSHVMCLYQAMMTFNFLNDITNDAESTQKSKITT